MSETTITKEQAEELDYLLDGPTDLMKGCIAVRDLMGRMEAVTFTCIEYHMLNACFVLIKIVDEKLEDEALEFRINDLVLDISTSLSEDLLRHDIPEILVSKIKEQCSSAIRNTGNKIREKNLLNKLVENMFGGVLRDVLKDLKRSE